MRILLKYPTKFRVEKSLSTLAKYMDLAADPSHIDILVSIDEDDPESIAAKPRYEAIHPGHVQVVVGPPIGKIGAVNRDMPLKSSENSDSDSFDILIMASDDMIPQIQGYDTIIREKMQQCYPDTDGVLFFNDGHQGSTLNTLVICGSAYYYRFGYIYYPEYKSFYCDNEFMDQANRLRKQTYFPQVIIEHQHPDIVKSISHDYLYAKNIVYWQHDKALYLSRKKMLDQISPVPTPAHLINRGRMSMQF